MAPAWHFWLVFGKSLVQILARTPGIITEVFHGFPQSLQAKAGMVVPQIRPWPIPSTSFQSYYFTIIHSFTVLLTPWSWVLDKLTVGSATQEITRIYGTWRFTTMFTRVRHWTMNLLHTLPFYFCKPILVLLSHLCLGIYSGLFFFFRSSHQTFYTLLFTFMTATSCAHHTSLILSSK
jgi:hypothetical protein